MNHYQILDVFKFVQYLIFFKGKNKHYLKKIVSKITKRPILINDILELFSREPELFDINKTINIIKQNNLKCFGKQRAINESPYKSIIADNNIKFVLI